MVGSGRDSCQPEEKWLKVVESGLALWDSASAGETRISAQALGQRQQTSAVTGMAEESHDQYAEGPDRRKLHRTSKGQGQSANNNRRSRF